MTILAGNKVDAADLSGLNHDGTADTSVGSAAANFTVNLASVRTALDGQLVYFHLYIQTTNALTASSGNIADVTCFTLDAAYRPLEVVSSVIGNGSMVGEAILNPSGTVSLRAAADTIGAGTNIRMSFCYLTT